MGTLLLHPILASVISWSASAAPAHAGLGRGRGTVCAAAPVIEEYDVVVIGAGIGGLSAAAVVASTGLSVCVCESHDTPGGAAHEWEIKGYHFESGPSLYAGLSADASPNPLKHVFQIIGEEPEWITYDRWGTHLPEGSLLHDAVGVEDFYKKLELCGGPDARSQVRQGGDRRARAGLPCMQVLTTAPDPLPTVGAPHEARHAPRRSHLRAAVGGGAYGWVGGAHDGPLHARAAQRAPQGGRAGEAQRAV